MRQQREQSRKEGKNLESKPCGCMTKKHIRKDNSKFTKFSAPLKDTTNQPCLSLRAED